MVGITACSNGLRPEDSDRLRALRAFLEGRGETVKESPWLFGREGPVSGTGAQRAQALTDLFRDPRVTDIFDISGGDMANEVLDFLDYGAIRDSRAVFWGYSDLTTVLNAIYARTGRPGVLYPVKNLVDPRGRALQQERFCRGQALFSPAFHMAEGQGMEGILVGGNARCFLKLAGTPYFPELQDKLLLLEALGGSLPQMITYLSQLRSLGAFRKVKGLVLGTFCQMEEEGRDMLALVRQFAGGLPIAVTRHIGHRWDAGAVWIGKNLKIG